MMSPFTKFEVICHTKKVYIPARSGLGYEDDSDMLVIVSSRIHGYVGSFSGCDIDSH